MYQIRANNPDVYSLLAQTFDEDDFEIIVINDGSKDKTKFALHVFGDDIRVIDHDENKGIIGDPNKDKSEALFRSYGRFIESLNGRYITAEDVNIGVEFECAGKPTKGDSYENAMDLCLLNSFIYERKIEETYVNIPNTTIKHEDKKVGIASS